MERIDWEHYFHSHYKPIDHEWGKKDLEKYRRWYKPWIEYFQRQFNFSFIGKNALELGCGIGAASTLLHDMGSIVVGSDIAETMVLHAKRLSPEIPFLIHDIMKPFPKKKKFDYIFAFEVLEHVTDLQKAMNNIYALLNPGGWFLGSTPFPYKKNMIDPTHVNVHPPSFWKEQFQSHKFTSVSTHPASFLPLLWRLPISYQPIIPWYIKYPYIVSTTLLVAQKK